MPKYRPLKYATLTAAMALAALDMAAVRATPNPLQITQPDGTTVTIMLHGDERSHYTTTTDGYLLLTDELGYMRYATLAADGTLAASELRAVDVDKRTAADCARLAAIDRDAVAEAQRQLSLQQIAASPLARSASLAPSRAEADELADHRAALNPTTPSIGKPNLLVVLIEFADTKFTMSSDLFERMLNEEGFSDQFFTGSIRDYFIDNSNGNYEPTFDMVGPITVANTSAYYAGKDGYDNSEELVVEVCELIDDEVDFSIYDIDNDGIVDNVYLFYAGYGQADTDDKSCIWPHSFQVYSYETDFDGKRLGNYTCSNELMGGSKLLAGIGTFCHEFSHALGLPDLYDVTYNNLNTPGLWTLMDSGSYNNNSRTPPALSAYERWVLGWVAPEELVANEPTDVKMRPLTDADGFDDVQLVRTSRSNEFFLLENRQQQGWDKYLPGHGMLMWHIFFNRNIWLYNQVNLSSTRPGIDIVEATGNASDSSTDAAPFPGTRNVTSHTICEWNGKEVGVALDNIYETPGGNIYFAVNGGNAQPQLLPVLAVPEVSATDVAFSWMAVDGVEYYTLTIADSEGNTIVSEQTTATTFTTTLDEGADYTARLAWTVATAESYYSERSFTTGYLPIATHRVEALDPTDLSDDAATVSWLPLPIATNYVVEVAAAESFAGTTITENFDDGQLHNEGWSATAPFVTKYYGEAPQAVCFNKTGIYLTTAPWKRPIDQASFMACTNNSISLAYLVIEVADAEGNWTEAYRLRPATYGNRATEGTVALGVEELGDDAWALRFSISTATNWVIVDDITITYADGYTYNSCDIGPFDAGNATSLEITGLQPATTYAYRVRAFDAAGEESQPSKWIIFTTTEATPPSAIDEIGCDAADGQSDSPWFTTTGIRLDHRPTQPGLYIHNHRIVTLP